MAESAGDATASSPPGAADPARSFEPHRRYLRGLAYRMLGSVAEAEDVVQDAFLRWNAADRDHVAEPRAYLARTASRLCLDRMKSASARRERYVIHGRDKILRFIAGLAGKGKLPDPLAARPARINGLPGFVIHGDDGVETLALEISGDAIVAIYAVRNPDKLGHVH